MVDHPIIKILVCYHKPDLLFKDDVLTPIHLGRALAKERMETDDPKFKWLMENLIGDDTGDNISRENPYYNELTGVYWAWKNYEMLGNPDYIGLIHYRRHFIFKDNLNMIDVEVNEYNEHYYDMLNYSPDSIKTILHPDTIIFHGGKVDSVYKHYADNHDIKQLDDALTIIEKCSPQLSKTARKYMTQSWGSFCNMFILPKTIFFDYCEWLFKILQEYVKTHDMTGKRLFISERLTGIYFQHLIDSGIKFHDYPITLLNTSIEVNIVLKWDNNLFDIVTLISSHLKEKKKSTILHFYLIGNLSDIDKGYLLKYSADNAIDLIIIPISSTNNAELSDFINSLPELIPNANKVVYLSTNVLCVKDCGEFFRTANVDDYWALGLPSSNDYISTDLLVLNLNKMRKNNLKIEYEIDLDKIQIKKITGQIDYLPYWMYILAEKEGCTTLFDTVLSRGDCQYRANWANYIYYNTYDPRYSIQGIYSIFWWNVATQVPSYIPTPNLDIGRQWDLLINQQKIINNGAYPKIDNKKTDKGQAHGLLKSVIRSIKAIRSR